MNKKITILGAGLAGSLLAILLRKKGYEVLVVERRDDIRNASLYAGKSINLAMSVRGWKALDMAGLRNEIEAIAIPMYGRQIHPVEGESIFQQYGKNNEAIYSVSRGELNKKLIALADAEGATFLFSERCISVDINSNNFTTENIHTKEITQHVNNEILIGSDGAFSALRQAYLFSDRFDFSQHYIQHGYKELHIPAGENDAFLLDKNVLHIWPRKNYMLIALPNLDGSFTCTLFFPFNGNPSFESLKTREEITAFFNKEFSSAIKIMPSLIDDYINNPTSSLITIKANPWIYKNKSMLLGDAAHAIVPFYGQGMNAAFEDCSVLMELLEEKSHNWDSVFDAYQEKRKINGDAVSNLAMQNFIEMRDLVADPKFLERKKIEKELGKLFPDQFNSVYEMVSFSHTPYSYAWKCTLAQNELLEKIMSKGDFDTNILNEEFKIILDEWMNNYAEGVK
jgi:kynurenine 3-monooxygenase